MYSSPSKFLLSELIATWHSFHIIANHSESVAVLGNQLDYLGVVILMWGSTIPSVYYGFYCDPELQKLYWSVVSSVLFFSTFLL